GSRRAFAAGWWVAVVVARRIGEYRVDQFDVFGEPPVVFLGRKPLAGAAAQLEFQREQLAQGWCLPRLGHLGHVSFDARPLPSFPRFLETVARLIDALP